MESIMETTKSRKRKSILPGPPTRDSITVNTFFPKKPPASTVASSYKDNDENSAQEEITAPVSPAVI